jgi:ribosomal protein S18 acetylase RimI-like enzyme
MIMPVLDLDKLIGRRVALRHRVSERTERPLFSDAVGELAAGESPAQVRVHTRRGVVTVDRSAVVAVREIPPAQPRRPSWASVARLENICADAWPPQVDQRLGQWRLRASGGFSGRANSALAVGDAGLPLADALERVRTFAAEHELVPKVQVPTGSPWHRAITGQGWELAAEHPAGASVLAMIGEVARLAAPAEPSGVRFTVANQPDDGWWALAGEPPITEGQRHVLLGAGLDRVGFGSASPRTGSTGPTAATGPAAVVRLAVVDEHLYLAQLAVLPEFRRQGLAIGLMDAAAGWALTQGARWIVLQVAEHNTTAIRLYERLGLRVHHRYEYLRPPAG